MLVNETKNRAGVSSQPSDQQKIPSGEIAISVKNLTKTYRIFGHPTDRIKHALTFGHLRFHREFTALQDVSFEVRQGETVGIIGHNGSGKSTLLQLICGILKPTSGDIRINGRISALLELGSGFNPEFTGRENIYFQGAILGIHKDEMKSRFDDIAAFADIGEFLDQPVHKYSSGMYVRLAFAVQSMTDPDVFVVDEALAVGDEKFQRKCFARLEELKSRGCSILFVSHSPANIIELCDRALLLDHGERLMYAAAPKTIRAYQRLIYAPIEEQPQLALKYRVADQSSERDADISLDPVIASNNQPSLSFDAVLTPETRVVYPMQGAEIESVRVLDTEGHIVNILQPGNIYRFEMAGRFMTDFAGIFFALHIRTISGVVITGQRYPEEGSYVEHVAAGESFKIDFKFRMNLLPDVYFVGCGVWSSQAPNCAHRILDALMFRVTPNEKLKSFGYVDAMASAPSLKITAQYISENNGH